jgi:hypothetical protein
VEAESLPEAADGPEAAEAALEEALQLSEAEAASVTEAAAYEAEAVASLLALTATDQPEGDDAKAVVRALFDTLRCADSKAQQERAKILMRDMRDTNLPKFVQADLGIFLYLINDLFPKLECPAVVDPKLSAAIKHIITAFVGIERMPPEEKVEAFASCLTAMRPGGAGQPCIPAPILDYRDYVIRERLDEVVKFSLSKGLKRFNPDTELVTDDEKAVGEKVRAHAHARDGGSTRPCEIGGSGAHALHRVRGKGG